MEFEDLEQNAKSNAISKYGEPPDDWYESVYSCYIGDKAVEATGMFVEHIHYAGFHSQGDGASWTGLVNIDAFIEHNVTPTHPNAGRYMVLLALMQEEWLGKHLRIYTKSFVCCNSSGMGLESASVPADVDSDYNEAVFAHGIFQGASVRDLTRSIGFDHLINDLEEWVLKEAKSLADEIYVALRDEYEAYTSEETFKELIYINGWRFDSKGNLLTEEEVSHGI